jgi:O-methyltransferase
LGRRGAIGNWILAVRSIAQAREGDVFYGLKNRAEGERLRSLLAEITQIFGRVWTADMLVAMHKNMGFLEDARFVAAFNAVAESEQEQSLAWRLHTLCWAAEHALQLPGDFVECGVHRGFSSAVVARYVDFATRDKRWFLYDAFGRSEEDAPDALPVDQRDEAEGRLHRDKARARFADFSNMQIVEGVVPGVLARAAPERISYLHIDLNSAQAELGALEQLFERLVPGALLVLDDYGWFYYRAQKELEDRFLTERGYRVLELPTGQGLVIKR